MTISVTAFPAGTPRPFVEVVVDSVPVGTVRLTVWRVVKGRRFKVRGMVNSLAAGGVTERDYECPFMVEASYQAEFFDALGLPLGYSETVTATLTGLGADEAWIHNPLDPSSAVKVRMLAGAAAEITRSTAATTALIPGRSVGLSFPGTRTGVTGVALDCYTATRDDGERFDALFGGYDSDALSIVCVCTRPEMWLPPTLFAFVSKPGMRPNRSGGEDLQWVFTGDETTPPTPAVITPLLTYDDFTAFYSTYVAFTAAYPDYLTASRDYSVIGA